MLYRRGVLLFSKVIHQIWRSHGTKIANIDPNLAFPDCNSSLNSRWLWLWNDAQSLMLYRRGALLFSKVIHHGTKHCQFWPKFSISGLQLQFEFTHGFEIIRKAWCSLEEVPYCFLRSSIEFQGHTGQKIANFDPNRAFPDCNFSFNSQMDLKWCTKTKCLISLQLYFQLFVVTMVTNQTRVN